MLNTALNKTFIAGDADELAQTGTNGNDKHIEWVGELDVKVCDDKHKGRLINRKEQVVFTHLWVNGFGWENTIYAQEDFLEVYFVCEYEIGDSLFFAMFDNGNIVKLKGVILD